MKLRNNVLCVVSSIWIIFLIITFTTSHFFLQHNLSTLQQSLTNQHVVQVEEMFDTDVIYSYLLGFVTIGIFSLISMLWLLRRFVIRRLEYLENEITEISDNNAFDKKVTVAGSDEITSLAAKVNGMLNTIQIAHEKLAQRVKERTQQLKHTHLQLQQEMEERQSIEKELVSHKEYVIQLEHYDPLTSLPNRVFFNEILNKTLHHAAIQKQTLAILFIDLDRFKAINDALGHPIGDIVLKEIASRFSTLLRTEDTLARLGGDEFIVLLNRIEQTDFAETVAKKLLHICNNPITVHAHELFVTASIGISIFPDDGNSLEDLQKNADMAMYKSKHAGGNVSHRFSKEMNFNAYEKIQLETALHKALQNQEFVLHYQPKFQITDGKIIGVEALIRWESPTFGMINPAQFIPLAEQTGLILPIGEWALREACLMNKTWQKLGYEPITMAVNLSPKQFSQPNIVNQIETILKETELDPHYLELEITESVVMNNTETTLEQLQGIERLGIAIAIDDFGIGYTSIYYLKEFPIHTLKMDQSFVKGIPHNTNDLAITSAVIALAHNLEIKVVAEGVETAEQLKFLTDHGCDIVQGYFLSRPLPSQKVALQLTKP